MSRTRTICESNILELSQARHLLLKFELSSSRTRGESRTANKLQVTLCCSLVEGNLSNSSTTVGRDDGSNWIHCQTKASTNYSHWTISHFSPFLCQVCYALQILRFIGRSVWYDELPTLFGMNVNCFWNELQCDMLHSRNISSPSFACSGQEHLFFRECFDAWWVFHFPLFSKIVLWYCNL